MITFLRDVRYALRSSLRQSGITLVIVLTLAVGIGSNTAILTAFLDMYRYEVEAPDPDRLLFVDTGTRRFPRGRNSYLDTLAYREALADVADLSPRTLFGAVLGLPGEGDGAGKSIFGLGMAVSPPHFDFFGVHFAVGRGFLPEERCSLRSVPAAAGSPCGCSPRVCFWPPPAAPWVSASPA